MNADEIIKALEYCTGIKKPDACAECPAHLGCNDCVDFLREESLTFIKKLLNDLDYWKQQVFNGCMDKRRLDDKIKELTEDRERIRDLVIEAQQYNEAWVEDNGRLRTEIKSLKQQYDKEISKLNAETAIVVKCKNCIHSKYNDYEGVYECDKLKLFVNGEFYCFYGIRRKNDE